MSPDRLSHQNYNRNALCFNCRKPESDLMGEGEDLRAVSIWPASMSASSTSSKLPLPWKLPSPKGPTLLPAAESTATRWAWKINYSGRDKPKSGFSVLYPCRSTEFWPLEFQGLGLKLFLWTLNIGFSFCVMPKDQSSFALTVHVALKQEMVHFSIAAWD